MKKIPKVITKLEIMQAYNEGKRGYYDGKRRGYNPYADLDQKELAAAWWQGWDFANAEMQGRRNIASPSSKDEPKET